MEMNKEEIIKIIKNEKKYLDIYDSLKLDSETFLREAYIQGLEACIKLIEEASSK